MYETPSQRELAIPAESAAAERLATSAPLRPPKRRRRARKIALITVASLMAVVGAVALGGFLTIRHLEGNIHRIPNVFAGLAAASRPTMPAATRNSMTILLTGSPTLPAKDGGRGIDASSTAPEDGSGLIALVHINASGKAAALVSIPPTAVVRVRGHGMTRIGRALQFGGPSLLIGTVERLTNVRIDHYSVVDFQGLAATLGPLHGVNVDLPDSGTSNGVAFHRGIDHLTKSDALDYVDEASLTEEDRVLRQQALLRAVLDKIAHDHLLGDPASGFSVLDAFTKALSVDSDFTNRDLQSLARHLHLLGAGAGTFVDAPLQPGHVRSALSRQLWNAIRNDAVAAFARQHPSTVTPAAPH
jgi:LCP family protein required for cell wall assembly